MYIMLHIKTISKHPINDLSKHLAMHVAVPPHAIMHCWVCQIFEGPSNLHGPMALHDERWLTGAVPVCSNHQYGDALP